MDRSQTEISNLAQNEIVFGYLLSSREIQYIQNSQNLKNFPETKTLEMFIH